ncbi:mediator of RNA polymerase II transcription subunit 10 [Ailuropoda melanoleuca]|uniref:mediator of RNA polymerase II transcription subunit 10 n=1 Tax=Ailuropoda melanoleuca TaxID=9646 RepID=UPI001493E066|nr:mediator of RNA polymerase II transcription subunit 10 [Ailuropoda melanoleuca]
MAFLLNSVANQRATRLVCVWNLCGALVGQLGGVPILLSSELTTCPIFAFSFRNFIVTGLQDIDKCRQQLHDITVPLEVFEYIDQGRNPQLYTKECLERALAKNEQVKGKIDTMKKFKSLLIQELSKVFPEDMAKYRSIRGEDHPPS